MGGGEGLTGDGGGMLGWAAVRPTSGGTGGGWSDPSSAGRETIPAIAAATTATTRPTLAHLICWKPIPA